MPYIKQGGRRGLQLPDEVALVGFDDSERAALASVPMTSVKQTVASLLRRIGARPLNITSSYSLIWPYGPLRSSPVSTMCSTESTRIGSLPACSFTTRVSSRISERARSGLPRSS